MKHYYKTKDLVRATTLIMHDHKKKRMIVENGRAEFIFEFKSEAEQAKINLAFDNRELVIAPQDFIVNYTSLKKKIYEQ